MENSFQTSTKKDLELFLSNNSFRKIFILAGNQSFSLSGLKLFFNSKLKNKSIKYYFKKASFPEYFELVDIISAIKNFSPDLIIAAGGGSVLDYAKIANAIDYENDLDNRIIGSKYNLKNSKAKLLAIPTTAGSGAEVTSNAVIYVNKIKYSIEGKQVKPDFFFLIPDFVKGASNKIKSSAGFDAIAQAIESLISKKSNIESVGYARKSLEISLKYYLKFLNNPNDENTCAMSFASNLAGKAINISKTTGPHAVSYPFTSIYNIRHGHAVSLTLNEFLYFNYFNYKNAKCDFDLKKRYGILFSLTQTNSFSDLDHYLIDLKKNAKLESDFNALGINLENSFSKIMSGINVLRLSNNPVDLDHNDIKNILNKAARPKTK
jgi:alcohol dehydrogenase